MKKLLSLISVLVIILAIGNISFAVSLTDIKGTKYESAVENLVEIGLVNGFEDNTYRPKTAVTRAQMAKLMVISLGQEDRVNTTKNQAATFKDVASGHWAYGYINAAKEIGIINGYTDGNFYPEKTVSYAEAITMAIRALEYEPKVNQSTESWPNNYINCAKDLSMLKNVASFTNGDPASRGEVAILLWNMLNTGVCKVTGSNNKGLTYGQGDIMLSRISNYLYINDGVITDIDFDDDFENATVTVKGTNTIKLSMSDTDVLNYFGKTLTILYNSKTKKIVSIDSVKKYKEVTGDVTNTTSKKITLDDDDDYTLPSKSSIFLYKCKTLDQAVEATVYLDGKTVVYVMAKGAKSINVGLVTETDITVSKKDGIKIKKVGSSSTSSYALIDEDDMPDKYSIIFYYLNSDDRLGIIKEIDSEDAYTISSLTSSKIKLGKTTYTYDSSNFVIDAVTSTTIKSLAFKSIDDEDDLVYPYVYNGKTYLIVFTDAVGSTTNKDTAYKDLQTFIKTASSRINSEASYSQSTYVPFKKAYDSATAIKSSDTISKINSALTDLKNTYNSLTSVSSYSADGKISTKRAELRKLVDGKAATIVKDKAKYTTVSYDKFNSALNTANKILTRTNTTLTEVTDAYDELNSIVTKGLELEADTDAYKTALAALNTALDRVKSLGSSADYTEASYAKYQKAYDTAVTIKNSAASRSSTELSNAAKNLNDGINGLESSVDSAKYDLMELVHSCKNFISNEKDYMPETFDTFKTAYNKADSAIDSNNATTMRNAIKELEDAKNGLEEIDKVLDTTKNAVNKMKDATHVKSALAYPDDKGKLFMINNIRDAVKLDIEDLITDALALAQDGKDSDGDLTGAITDARKAMKLSDINKWVDGYLTLKTLVDKASAK